MTDNVVDGQTVIPENTEVTPPVRPDNIPEKFWDAEKGAVNTEALLNSYSELEKLNSKPTEVDPNAPPEVTPPVEPTASDLYTQTVEKATAELAEGGVITEETYEAFKKQGVTPEQVDTYIEGQQAKFELRKIYAEREAGGEDAYNAMLQWAGQNYSAEDAETFNNSVYGASRDNAMEAVRGLKARYEDAMGTEGKIVTDGTGKSVTTGGYANKTEWQKDLRDPKYKKDESFRESVRKKLEVSLTNGVDMGVGARIG